MTYCWGGGGGGGLLDYKWTFMLEGVTDQAEYTLTDR